jgi:1-acyl-sn-glycerol-3-phosphate acyltransferase
MVYNVFSLTGSTLIATRSPPGLQFYKWLVVIPVLVISTAFIGTIVIILSLIGMPEFSSRVFGKLWARVNMAVMFMRVQVYGRENIDTKQSYVIAANHQSQLDIYVLYGYLDIPFKWAMKKELRRVPILGLACELMGHIYIDRSNADAARASLSEAQVRIKDGISAVFFPEGTRSRSGQLGSFKKGAFRLAQDLTIPVLPVSIHDTKSILPSDGLDWRPGSATLRIHPAITQTGVSPADINALTARTREVISEALFDE